MTARARRPFIEKADDGILRLRAIPPVMAAGLWQLPALLDPEAPWIAGRAGGAPYAEDDEGARLWEKHAAPELAHLFGSARDVVTKDLRGLAPEEKPRGGFRVDVPGGHLDAWLSALSAARVGMWEHHGFTAAELEGPLPKAIETDRHRALVLIHVLGWVQGLLLGPGA